MNHASVLNYANIIAIDICMYMYIALMDSKCCLNGQWSVC